MIIKHFFIFLTDLYKIRALIWQLTKRDFKSRYLGSYLGLLWAFIHPSVTIMVLWFVFQVGFKSRPVQNVPFILWLMSGIIPWFFFSEAFASASNSIVEYNYLVKKVVFRVSALPLVKILSATFIHLFFNCGHFDIFCFVWVFGRYLSFASYFIIFRRCFFYW